MDNIYFNIGTEKCSFVVPVSEFLLKIVTKYPLLYFAIEEAVLCAKRGYYSAGILAFSQILNQFQVKTPKERHEVAHKILTKRPDKRVYESISLQLKKAAQDKFKNELGRARDPGKYHRDLFFKWCDLQRSFNSNR